MEVVVNAAGELVLLNLGVLRQGLRGRVAAMRYPKRLRVGFFVGALSIVVAA
jgi:hypothetical protein